MAILAVYGNKKVRGYLSFEAEGEVGAHYCYGLNLMSLISSSEKERLPRAIISSQLITVSFRMTTPLFKYTSTT